MLHLFVFARIHDHIELESSADPLPRFLIEQILLQRKLGVPVSHIVSVGVRHEVAEVHLGDERPIVGLHSKVVMSYGSAAVLGRKRRDEVVLPVIVGRRDASVPQIGAFLVRVMGFGSAGVPNVDLSLAQRIAVLVQQSTSDVGQHLRIGQFVLGSQRNASGRGAPDEKRAFDVPGCQFTCLSKLVSSLSNNVEIKSLCLPAEL